MDPHQGAGITLDRMTDITDSPTTAEARALTERGRWHERWLEPDEGYGEEYGWLLPGIRSESAEHVVELCRRIVADHAAQCIDGVLVDAWTAAAIVQLADGLNETNRAKFLGRRAVAAMGKVAQDVCFRA